MDVFVCIAHENVHYMLICNQQLVTVKKCHNVLANMVRKNILKKQFHYCEEENALATFVEAKG